MKAHFIRFEDVGELSGALTKTGCYPGSFTFFESRRDSFQICVSDVPAPAANIIKQEMLSRGGDAAIHAQVITGGIPKSGVIIFGTRKQFALLADKLSIMPWWGLPRLAEDIRSLIAPTAASEVTLPCGASLTFGGKTHLMGIINLTEDSFFAESRSVSEVSETVRRALSMAEAGTDIIDIGAESTRPGAKHVDEDLERSRIAEAVKALRKELPHFPISVDTTRTSAAKAALDEGADIINDVSGLRDEQVARSAAEYGAALVVMHTRGTPETMSGLCDYDDLLEEVCSFLKDKASQAEAAGVARDKIILDPGIGFAKNYSQNLMLLRHCESFKALGYPLLVGASRKGFIGSATGKETPEERLCGTLAVTALCCRQGVDIIRVHDVRENKEVVMMTEAVRDAAYV